MFQLDFIVLTKRVQSPDHPNAGIFVSFPIHTIISLHAGNLAKGMTPASQIHFHAISVQISLKNNKLKPSTDGGM